MGWITDCNGFQWDGMRTGIQWNGMRTGMRVGIRWSVWWKVLGECAGKRCAEIAIRAAIIETFIPEETFAFFAFLHSLHLNGCHKTSLFLLKFHALFNGSLDSFSTSGRVMHKVMQR